MGGIAIDNLYISDMMGKLCDLFFPWGRIFVAEPEKTLISLNIKQ